MTTLQSGDRVIYHWQSGKLSFGTVESSHLDLGICKIRLDSDGEVISVQLNRVYFNDQICRLDKDDQITVLYERLTLLTSKISEIIDTVESLDSRVNSLESLANE